MKSKNYTKQRVLFSSIIIAIIVFDQITKYFSTTILQHLPGGQADFIHGFMSFYYVENTGMAFSLFSNATWLLAIISAVLAVVVIVILFKNISLQSWLFKISLCFIAGGAVGNLIDRIFRGFVVDMLKFDFVDFAIFNVADSFVTVGAVLLGVFIIWFWEKSKGELTDAQKD